MLEFILFAVLFIVVFVVLSAIGLLLKIFTWGSSGSRKFGANSSGMNNSQSNSSGRTYRGASQEEGEKVFDKDEGEYVDFVEIKEDK